MAGFSHSGTFNRLEITNPNINAQKAYSRYLLKTTWEEIRRTKQVSANSARKATAYFVRFFPIRWLETAKMIINATRVKRIPLQAVMHASLPLKNFKMEPLSASPHFPKVPALKANAPVITPMDAMAMMINAPQMDSQSSLCSMSDIWNFSATTTSSLTGAVLTVVAFLLMCTS